MSKNVRNDATLVSLANVPALPEASYRQRLRGVIQKYRHKNRLGWVKIIKEGMLPLVPREEMAGLENEAYFGTGRLKRQLTYWCDEDGDLKDAKLIYLIEHFLEYAAPDLMAQFITKRKMHSLGQNFSDFLSIPAAAREHYMFPTNQLYSPLYKTGVEAGVFVLLDHDILPIKIKPQRFIVFSDIGENDFLVAQELAVSWGAIGRPQPLVMKSFQGFCFPFAANPEIIMRSSLGHSHDTYSIFVLKDEERPEVLMDNPRYVLSLAAAGLGFKRTSRIRDHVIRLDDSAATTAAIMQIASHAIWDV